MNLHWNYIGLFKFVAIMCQILTNVQDLSQHRYNINNYISSSKWQTYSKTSHAACAQMVNIQHSRQYSSGGGCCIHNVPSTTIHLMHMLDHTITLLIILCDLLSHAWITKKCSNTYLLVHFRMNFWPWQKTHKMYWKPSTKHQPSECNVGMATN